MSTETRPNVYTTIIKLIEPSERFVKLTKHLIKEISKGTGGVRGLIEASQRGNAVLMKLQTTC